MDARPPGSCGQLPSWSRSAPARPPDAAPPTLLPVSERNGEGFRAEDGSQRTLLVRERQGTHGQTMPALTHRFNVEVA